MYLTQIAMNPWDFTLYAAEDGSRVMKVMFCEGDYRVDISRFFLLAKSHVEIDDSIGGLKEGISGQYPQ
jgi:hypothetical protein